MFHECVECHVGYRVVMKAKRWCVCGACGYGWAVRALRWGDSGRAACNAEGRRAMLFNSTKLHIHACLAHFHIKDVS